VSRLLGTLFIHVRNDELGALSGKDEGSGSANA
jgi:hypothetical protein